MNKRTQKFMLDLVTYALLIAGSGADARAVPGMVATSFKLPADQLPIR